MELLKKLKVPEHILKEINGKNIPPENLEQSKSLLLLLQRVNDDKISFTSKPTGHWVSITDAGFDVTFNFTYGKTWYFDWFPYTVQLLLISHLNNIQIQ